MESAQKWHDAQNWQLYLSIPITYEQLLASVERELLASAMNASGFNRTEASRLLHISYRTFRYRAEQAGMGKQSNGRNGLPRGRMSVFDRMWPRLRMDALKRYGARCHCCGAGPQDERLDVDHIKPRNLFPSLELNIENLQILCRQCHASKGSKDTTDWRTPT